MQNYYPDDSFPKTQVNSLDNSNNKMDSSFDIQSMMKLLNSNNSGGLNVDMLMTLLKNKNPQIANLLPLINGMKSNSLKQKNQSGFEKNKKNTDEKYISVSKYYEDNK